MSAVPSALMAQNRQFRWGFRVMAVLCILLAGVVIAGSVQYVRSGRVLKDDSRKLGGEVQRLKGELAGAESRLASAGGATESRLTSAEQAKKDAEQKRDTAEQTRKEAEQKWDAAERARKDAEEKRTVAERSKTDLETRLKAVEQARLDAEVKLTTVDRARVEAETKSAESLRQVAALQEDAKRLQADVRTYRQDAQAAVESERKSAQRLQEALVNKVTSDRENVHVVVPTAVPNVPQASVAQDKPDVVQAAGSGEKTPQVAERSEPVRELPRPKDAQLASRVERGPSTRPAESQPELSDALLQDGKPQDLLRWGEAMIVAAHFDRGITLVRTAMERGGQGADYQKSLGWALLAAGRQAEAKAAFDAALAGFEDWPTTSSNATPDHWTAAFLSGRVGEEEYARRYARDEKFGNRLACLPWFYVGQRREIEGHREEAVDAYQVCVNLGQAANSHPIWRWAQQRLQHLTPPAGTSANVSVEDVSPATRPMQ